MDEAERMLAGALLRRLCLFAAMALAIYADHLVLMVGVSALTVAESIYWLSTCIAWSSK